MNILITGGTSGVGKATVRLLAKNRDNFIFFTYCTNRLGAEQIEKEFSNTRAVFCDFNDSKSVDDLVEHIAEMKLDVLLNNAYSGDTVGNYFYRTEVEEFERAFKVNVVPLVKITQEVIKGFRKRKTGKIITVLTSALIGTPPMGYSVYAATKAYIAQLVKQWSREYIQYGITSNAVSPDFMKTELTKDINENIEGQILDNSALKRFLLPEEVAEVIVGLCNATQYINGVNIPVNAGKNI